MSDNFPSPDQVVDLRDYDDENDHRLNPVQFAGTAGHSAPSASITAPSLATPPMPAGAPEPAATAAPTASTPNPHVGLLAGATVTARGINKAIARQARAAAPPTSLSSQMHGWSHS